MLNQIPIVDGPSAEELFLALRLNHECRHTTFAFNFQFRTKPVKIQTSIQMIRSEDSMGELWSCELFFQPSHLPSYYYEEIEGKKFMFYSTRKRKGVLTSEKVLVNLRCINDLYITNQTSPELQRLKLSVVETDKELGSFITDILE